MKAMVFKLLIVTVITGMPLNVQAAAKVEGNFIATGEVSATSFSGNGTELTNIPGTAITDASITVNHLASGAVTTDKMADSAVTAAKISFLGKVAIVATSGGDYSNPAIAMLEYATWCGTPSASNTCLLKILPGTYNVGAATVQMQNYIDIEGSGENVTVITGNVDSATAGTVNGAANSELRFVTVKNTGGGIYAMAVYNTGTSVKVTNVTAAASGATWNYGIYNASSTPKLFNVTATASGGTGSYAVMNGNSSTVSMVNVTATAAGASGSNVGVYNHTASATMMGVMASGSGGTTLSAGVNNYAGSGSYPVKILNSIISGSMYSVSAVSNMPTYVGSSEFRGGLVLGSVTCAGVYNASYVFYANTCP